MNCQSNTNKRVSVQDESFKLSIYLPKDRAFLKIEK